MPELLRIGVDVGGTNTDAVLLRGRERSLGDAYDVLNARRG